MASNGEVPALGWSLTPAQRLLTEVIWYGLSASVEEGAEASDWPVWDYVAEQFDRRADAAFDDAADVLSSMPTLPPPRLHTRPYGPVWRAGTDTDEPALGERVGLTVVGLAQLSPAAMPVALAHYVTVEVIRGWANWSYNDGVRSPNSVRQDLRLLASYATQINLNPLPAFWLNTQVLGSLLQREYPPLRVFTTGGGHWHFEIDKRRLRDYRDVNTTTDYLAVVAAAASRIPDRSGAQAMQLNPYVTPIRITRPSEPGRAAIEAHASISKEHGILLPYGTDIEQGDVVEERLPTTGRTRTLDVGHVNYTPAPDGFDPDLAHVQAEYEVRALAAPVVSGDDAARRPGARGSTVFLVHGHDGDAKWETVHVIQQLTGRNPTILHEQAHRGRTIIEQFEVNAADAAAAVILLTPDDYGGPNGSRSRGEEPKLRARQNVVFEFGYFAGYLGRERVIALVKGDVEFPSDIAGSLYVEMDHGGWQQKLGQNLKAIPGLHVDMNNLT